MSKVIRNGGRGRNRSVKKFRGAEKTGGARKLTIEELAIWYHTLNVPKRLRKF